MSVSDFFAQGGYGFYVWSSYGMVAALVVAEVVLLGVRRRAALARAGQLAAAARENAEPARD